MIGQGNMLKVLALFEGKLFNPTGISLMKAAVTKSVSVAISDLAAIAQSRISVDNGRSSNTWLFYQALIVGAERPSLPLRLARIGDSTYKTEAELNSALQGLIRDLLAELIDAPEILIRKISEARININSSMINPLIINAIKNDKLETLSALIKAGRDPARNMYFPGAIVDCGSVGNVQNYDMKSAIYYAVEHNKLDALEILNENTPTAPATLLVTADDFLSDYDGRVVYETIADYPLLLALRNNNEEAVNILLPREYSKSIVDQVFAQRASLVSTDTSKYEAQMKKIQKYMEDLYVVYLAKAKPEPRTPAPGVAKSAAPFAATAGATPAASAPAAPARAGAGAPAEEDPSKVVAS